MESPPGLCVLDAQHHFDLTASYDFGERATLTAEVNNILDRDLPTAARDASEFYTFPSTMPFRAGKSSSA